MADKNTLEFYAKEAVTYAAKTGADSPSEYLLAFLDRLPAGATILELGTGSGSDAAHMISEGFNVTPTDASPELAAQASRRLGQGVAIMRFDQLSADSQYDGVWASASLLHAPREELTEDLTRIFRALKPGGQFAASFKLGEGEGRDKFDRYYNYLSEAELAAHMQNAGRWSGVSYALRSGSGYDDVPTQWIWVSATR